MLTSLGYVSMQWVWLGLMIVLTVIEAATFNLVTIWFAVAALVMVFLSMLLESFSLPAQALVFLLISAALLVFTRPIAVRKLKVGRTKTNIDSLVGKRVILSRAVGEFEKGEVRVGGLVWSAVSEDGKPIPKGGRCEILRVEGVKLVVRSILASEND
ncbi:MAG: NfeD family protein [Treponema sp.]|nr:NfeD family protein [Treponema sp.]